MHEFITGVVEAVSGYLAGRFRVEISRASHISRIIISLAFGLMFFCAFGVYELISPAPNPIGNIWLGLLSISFGLSFFVYLMLLIDYLIKKNQGR